jgi:hypothetical protein
VLRQGAKIKASIRKVGCSTKSAELLEGVFYFGDEVGGGEGLGKKIEAF